MATDTDLRYQVYFLKSNGDLGKRITIPISTLERAKRYFDDCRQCALVSIDKHGAIVEIIEKNTTPMNNKNYKPKTLRR